jgi:catalase (peroxidase I)
MARRKNRNDGELEIIPWDDPRLTYYYKPWERGQTGEGPIVWTATPGDYVDIWYLKLTTLQWYAERSPQGGIAGVKIWGKDWEIHELVDLYSPNKDSKIELLKAWDFEQEDEYTITLLNTGEKNEAALEGRLSHAYFKFQ